VLHLERNVENLVHVRVHVHVRGPVENEDLLILEIDEMLVVVEQVTVVVMIVTVLLEKIKVYLLVLNFVTLVIVDLVIHANFHMILVEVIHEKDLEVVDILLLPPIRHAIVHLEEIYGNMVYVM